ncbi:MAG: PilN domain-containing protein [Desulfobacterales bacterium]|nr:MAG: PilN domain-containing protein [Desulfobacterales bacterium]
MIRINLLPFRAARKKENIRRQVSIFLLSLILVLLGLFGFNHYLGSKIDALNEDIKRANAELNKYNEINKEIARIKQTLENLKKKMDVITTLELNRQAPVRLMDTLTKAVIAKRMWFTSLEDQDSSVKIDGIALDNKTVADFMVRLQACGLFKSVNLKTLKHKEIEGNNLKEFKVTCDKTPLEGQEEKPETTKAKT